MLVDDKCVDNCPEGYSLKSGKCIKCVDTKCKKCAKSENICEECTSPKILLNDICVDACPENNYVENNKCKGKILFLISFRL